MRVFSILIVVGVTYMSVCSGQGGTGIELGLHATDLIPQDGSVDTLQTDNKVGLLATQLGVPPVPGVSVQGQPQGRPGSDQLNNFPPNIGGGIFTQPENFNPVGDFGVHPVPGQSVQDQPQGRPGSGQLNNFPPNIGGGSLTQPGSFNPVGVTYLSSFNCGPNHPLPDGRPAQCNPIGPYPCCDPVSGWCGKTFGHCACPKCIDYTSGNSLTGVVGGGNSGCRCHPRNQVCPTNTRSRQTAGFKIANANDDPCPGQQSCCSPDAVPNAFGSLVDGPQPVGPIIPSPNQPNCGFRTFPPSPNPLEAGFGEFPWMTAITGPNNEYLGGGALISNNVVLTAAHKIHNHSPDTVRIRVGDYNLASVEDHPTYRHVEVDVQRIVIHPEFSIDELHNDVGLLYLSQPVNLNQRQFPHIESVCMPEQGQIFDSQRCWVTGWGKNTSNDGQFQSVLKKVDVPILDSFDCEERLRSQPILGPNFNLDKTDFLCAGGEPGKDACDGDGGSPLVCEGNNGRFAVVGLVAWGLGCAQRDVPGVYVNVANYVNFIKNNTDL